jgi:hypothetical protein
MSCRMTGKQSGLAAGKNKRALGGLVSSGVVPGLAGYLGSSPVGQISLGHGEEANGLLRAANVPPARTLASHLQARGG